MWGRDTVRRTCPRQGNRRGYGDERSDRRRPLSRMGMAPTARRAGWHWLCQCELRIISGRVLCAPSTPYQVGKWESIDWPQGFGRQSMGEARGTRRGAFSLWQSREVFAPWGRRRLAVGESPRTWEIPLVGSPDRGDVAVMLAAGNVLERAAPVRFPCPSRRSRLQKTIRVGSPSPRMGLTTILIYAYSVGSSPRLNAYAPRGARLASYAALPGRTLVE